MKALYIVVGPDGYVAEVTGSHERAVFWTEDGRPELFTVYEIEAAPFLTPGSAD